MLCFLNDLNQKKVCQLILFTALYNVATLFLVHVLYKKKFILGCKVFSIVSKLTNCDLLWNALALALHA